MSCVVPLCPNQQAKKEKDISFHRFPADSALKEVWVGAISRGSAWQPSFHHRICSTHFREEDFDRTNPNRIRLLPGAVPCRLLAEEEQILLKLQKRFEPVPPNDVIDLQPPLEIDRHLIHQTPPDTEMDGVVKLEYEEATEVQCSSLFDLPGNCSPSSYSQKRVDYGSLQKAVKGLMEKRKARATEQRRRYRQDPVEDEQIGQDSEDETEAWKLQSKKQLWLENVLKQLYKKVDALEAIKEKMASNVDDSFILNLIQDTYVPFLKKLIAFLEKKNKSTPENLTKLKAIYTIFTTADPQEQVETFHANKKKLENWYSKAQKDKQHSIDGDSNKGSKRSLAGSDTESSQGACDTTQPPSKKVCSFTNAVDSDSSQPAILKVQSVNQNSSSSLIDVSHIKKEKTDAPTTNNCPPAKPNPPQVPQPNPPPAPATPQPADPEPNEDEPIVYTCASCQFQTNEEAEFMKHARTDHRTDLSMWCKQCGKCFSNAGVLISHIKERACCKEEMIYKCGVKDCIFETTSGQTFVHHLRHCHKGSPFIFCVHCQKIFTLPHCLILHMQDDCPFKEKNRRNPGSTPVQPAAKRNDPPKTTTPVINVQAQLGQTVGIRAITPKPTPPVVARPVTVRTPVPLMNISRGRGGRGRGGRGRGRGRVRISSSSDSDDPDDPSWRPEETLGDTGLRRSGRWAKKINDVMNPEPSTSGVSTVSTKKSFVVDAEINSKMINCPCCDFMAAFQSVLEDHYIANHKVPNKNSCLVCHLKFENTRSFLDHFEEHRKGTLPNGPPPSLSDTPASTPVQATATATATPVSVQPTSTQATSTPATSAPLSIQVVSATSVASVSTSNESVPTCKVSGEPSLFDGVLVSIVDAKLMDLMSCQDKALVIPYQAAIHDKNLKDSKLSKFEELKSPNDLIVMKTIEKLQHFFKCSLYSCSFTTDSFNEFADHLKMKHEGKRHHCCYCFKEETSSNVLASHIVLKHNKRTLQCSKCFYRACDKAHLQIHINDTHSQDVHTDIVVCESVQPPDNVSCDQESDSEGIHTTYPYICAIGDCNFSSYIPKDFKRHNEMFHRTVSVFYCHYCKVDFLTFKRLMNHYRLHGLNLFQCVYCIHGSETKDEILLHLCSVHADQPLKAYMRGSNDEVTSEMKNLSTVASEASNGSDFPNIQPEKTSIQTLKVASEKKYSGYEDLIYHVIDNNCYPSHMHSSCYPKFLKNLLSGVICGVPFCNETFPSLELYISHLRSDHDALNLPCPYCPEMCSTWDDFQNHLLCHTSKLYACGVEDCDYYDWNKDRVKGHKKQHDGVENGPIAIREYASLEEENKLHAMSLGIQFPVVSDPFVCIFCKYQCGSLTTMKNHMYREMAYQRFDCSLCEMKCLSRKDIKNHFIDVHPDLDIMCSPDYNFEIEKSVRSALVQRYKLENAQLSDSCDMCCKKFKNPLRLQFHLNLCLQKEYRPYECDHCKKWFPSLLVLKYHIDEDHDSKPIKFSYTPSSAVEDDMEKNLLKVRLKQLKDILEQSKIEVITEEMAWACKIKFYTCSECSYEAHHKYNVQRHCKLTHGSAAKVMKGIQGNINSQLDDNSSDNTITVIKRFSCGYCVRKMLTLHEVEMHVRKAHIVKNNDYFYYYTPNTDKSFSASDKEIYECAYCKSTRENLFALKKHADLMHSEMEFKVKGSVSFQELRKSMACGYCYMKVSNSIELHSHSTSAHPLLPLKSFDEFHGRANWNKLSADFADDIPNKRVKFNSSVFVCSHCGGAYASEDHLTAHSKKVHSRLGVKFIVKEQSLNNSTDSADLRFYKCEFCRFTSEKQFLEKHLASKHKMRVTCSYCNKRFEFASKLKEHHDVVHKDLPLSYSQETFSNADDLGKVVKEEKSGCVSHYGKKPEPIDLSSITVHMEMSEGNSAILPLVYVTQRFNFFPKVVLHDIVKEQNRKKSS